MLHIDDTQTEAAPATAPAPIILAPRPVRRRSQRFPRWLAVVLAVLLLGAAPAGWAVGEATTGGGDEPRPGVLAQSPAEVMATSSTMAAPGTTTTGEDAADPGRSAPESRSPGTDAVAAPVQAEAQPEPTEPVPTTAVPTTEAPAETATSTSAPDVPPTTETIPSPTTTEISIP